MSEARSVVVAAAPAVLGDAIVELLRRAGVQDVCNASRDPARATGHFGIAVVSPGFAATADADMVIVLPDAGSETVIDLTSDVIDLVAEEQRTQSPPGAGV